MVQVADVGGQSVSGLSGQAVQHGALAAVVAHGLARFPLGFGHLGDDLHAADVEIDQLSVDFVNAGADFIQFHSGSPPCRIIS